MPSFAPAPNTPAPAPPVPVVSTEQKRARILIGPMSSDPTESVSGVNAAFVEGLRDRHDFLPLDATRKHGTTRQSMLNVTNLFYFTQQFSRWLAHLAFRRPDLAHYAISSGWAMEKGLILMKLARLFGAKTLGHLHSGEFIDHWNALPKWRKIFARREFSRLDGLVLASQWWCDEIRQHLPLPADQFFVVNNPIDPTFEGQALEMSVERKGNVVLSLGTMGRAKGVFEMLEASDIVARRASFDLQLVGSEREPNILKEVREFVVGHALSETVHVQSAVTVEEKTELYRKASIFLLPSHFENFPLVLVEAAAAGQAIITTPVGAVPEFFQDGVSAIFVEPRRPDQIAAALLKLIQQPNERVRMGQAARAMFCSRLARSRIMESLQSTYRQILS
jgi:glycosyltransferase involved in cell wall biosynthesis